MRSEVGREAWGVESVAKQLRFCKTERAFDRRSDVGYNVDDNPHSHGGSVKTIQMTIDEPLLAEVDQTIQMLETTRSAFIRQALQLALRQQKIAELERRHREGYAQYPVQPGEFDVWEAEQMWGDI